MHHSLEAWEDCLAEEKGLTIDQESQRKMLNMVEFFRPLCSALSAEVENFRVSTTGTRSA